MHRRTASLPNLLFSLFLASACSSSGEQGHSGGSGGAGTGGSATGAVGGDAGRTGGVGNGGVSTGGAATGGAGNGGVSTGGAGSGGGGASGGGGTAGGATGGAGSGGGASGGGGAAGSATTGGAGSGGGGASGGGGTAGSGGATSGGTGGGTQGSQLIGWAANAACGPNGTTGGGLGNPTVVVNTADEFRSAMLASGPAIIEFSGTIPFSGQLSGVRDKTVIGTNDAELSGNLTLEGARNVIFKNILFKNPSSEAGIDTFELSGSECVWFDHCEFVDGTDGTLDIVRASDYVTVSWSKIYYTKANNHMLACLCGNGNDATEDEGKINVTFHHNWWGAGIRSRAPRVRFGKVHVFNNYYRFVDVPDGGGDNSKIVAGYNAKLLVENNYFEDTRTPMEYEEAEPSELVERGNVFVNCGSEGTSRGTSFMPPYPYTLDAGQSVKDLVMSGAGRR